MWAGFAARVQLQVGHVLVEVQQLVVVELGQVRVLQQQVVVREVEPRGMKVLLVEEVEPGKTGALLKVLVVLCGHVPTNKETKKQRNKETKTQRNKETNKRTNKQNKQTNKQTKQTDIPEATSYEQYMHVLRHDTVYSSTIKCRRTVSYRVQVTHTFPIQPI